MRVYSETCDVPERPKRVELRVHQKNMGAPQFNCPNSSTVSNSICCRLLTNEICEVYKTLLDEHTQTFPKFAEEQKYLYQRSQELLREREIIDGNITPCQRSLISQSQPKCTEPEKPECGCHKKFRMGQLSS